MAKILVVDDEKHIRQMLELAFTSIGYEVRTAGDARSALSIVKCEPDIDVVLTDLRMARMDGLALLKEIHCEFPRMMVILMTAHGTVEDAVRAMKAGAHDYLMKPLSLDGVRHTVQQALEVRHLRAENQVLRDVLHDAPIVESRSDQMQLVLSTARQAARSDATILLTGESGTGKNVLARQIHDWSPRARQPFVVVNCTTLSDHLLESELFGHVRGAFTGAVKEKPGRLEAAEGGTIFLDEISELSAGVQAKLLRFLQERRFERLGGQDTIEIDARIVAATNRDLDVEVAEHRFREDLFYRLNTISLRVPALRERAADIPALAGRLLAAAAVRSHRSGLTFTAAAMGAMQTYRWPGNIRELRNVIDRAAILTRSDGITEEGLPDRILCPAPVCAPRAERLGTLEELERERIRQVLTEASTLEDAAATLGISTTTLWRKRKRYGIE